ncbi:MAG: hypothetical protein IKM97_02735 [Clostridia bacterium]|nr:hypothetical protein [Clostridia bacterium]
MEFTKDIYFEDELKVGKETQIVYSGFLFQNGANSVNIVYGFGKEWNHTTTKQMEKQENGFAVNIQIEDYDIFNFCFSDNNNNWDNNNNLNYISNIIPNSEEDAFDYSSYKKNLQEIEDLFYELFNNSPQKENKPLDTVPEQPIEFINNDSLYEIDDELVEAFDKLFEPLNASFNNIIKNDTKPVQTLDSLFESENTASSNAIKQDCEPVQTLDSLFESENTALSDAIKQDCEPVQTSDSLFESENTTSSNAIKQDDELVKAFNSLFELVDNSCYNKIENISTNKAIFLEEEIIKKDTLKNNNLNVSSFNLDGLVSDLLEPVLSSQINSEKNLDETSLFEDIKDNENKIEEQTSLTIINSDGFSVSSRKLGYFYKLRKRLRLAIMKLAKSSKEFVKQLGF